MQLVALLESFGNLLSMSVAIALLDTSKLLSALSMSLYVLVTLFSCLGGQTAAVPCPIGTGSSALKAQLSDTCVVCVGSHCNVSCLTVHTLLGFFFVFMIFK